MVGNSPPAPATSTRFVGGLFNGVAPSYDRGAQALALFQYLRWRRELVSLLEPAPKSLVLDVCTGTAGVAIEVVRRYGSRVVGLDLSRGMLLKAVETVDVAGLDGNIKLVMGTAGRLPFPDNAFDAVVFTFLLRYVDDVPGTLREVSRVLKPGGRLASLEFGVPPSPVWRGLWVLYTRAVLPVAALPLSACWLRVGTFLGRSISDFYRRNDIEALCRMWRDAGISDVSFKRLSLGGAILTWGTKPIS